MKSVILASSSPRRALLLEQMGIRFESVVPDIDETPQTGESPHDYVARMALEKAQAAQQQLPAPIEKPIVAADTAVVVDNIILGKPVDRQDAENMLAMLVGRTHQVLSALCVALGETYLSAVQISHVTMQVLSPAEITHYCQQEQVLDKAGAYGIQGLAAVFIEKLEGSYSGVMGLPLFELNALLASLDKRESLF